MACRVFRSIITNAGDPATHMNTAEIASVFRGFELRASPADGSRSLSAGEDSLATAEALRTSGDLKMAMDRETLHTLA